MASLSDFGLLLVHANGTTERIRAHGLACGTMCARAFGSGVPYDEAVQEGFPFVFYFPTAPIAPLQSGIPLLQPHAVSSSIIRPFVNQLVHNVFPDQTEGLENSALHAAPSILIGRRLVSKAARDLQLVMPATELGALESRVEQLVRRAQAHDEDLELLRRVYHIETLVVDMGDDDDEPVPPFENLFEPVAVKPPVRRKLFIDALVDAPDVPAAPDARMPGGEPEPHSDTASWPAEEGADEISEDLFAPAEEEADEPIIVHHAKRPSPKPTKHTAHAQCTYLINNSTQCAARAIYRTKGFFCGAHRCPACTGGEPHKMQNGRQECFACMRRQQRAGHGPVEVIVPGVDMCVYKDRTGVRCENKAVFRKHMVSFCKTHRCAFCQVDCHKVENGYAKCSVCRRSGRRKSTLVLETLEEPVSHATKKQTRTLGKRKLRSEDHPDAEPSKKRYKF